MRVAERTHQSFLHREVTQKSATRWKSRINQTPEAPTAFQFARESFQFGTVAAVSPARADVGAHARSGDDVYFDPIFFQHLDYANVREAFGGAGRQRETDQASADFPGETAEIFVEQTFWADLKFGSVRV